MYVSDTMLFAFVTKSVEGIWQGLKVFEMEDIDTSKFDIKNIKGIKRTVRTFGKPLGHRKGINGSNYLIICESTAKFI